MSGIENRIETGDINGPEKTGDANILREGAEKLLILPVNEDSRKITQTLSNETSLKILELLGKKNLSASDIAGELKIPLTTVKYNIDSLVESELVQVKQIKWSRKGRQVKIYEAMEKLILLVPNKGFADKLSIISMLQQYIGVIAGAFFASVGIEYLTTYLRARSLLKAVPWVGPARLPEASYYAPAPAAMAAISNASEDGQGGLSPKIMESPGLIADYNVFNEGVVPENESLNEAPSQVFAGDIEEEFAEEIPEEISEEAMVAQEAPMKEGFVEAAPVEESSREMLAEESPVEETSMEEVPVDAEMPAAEALEVPEMEESAPPEDGLYMDVAADEAAPLDDALEGMDSSALDSVPPGTLGASTGHHFFDTLLAHPGVWFLSGCLFVIFLLIVREVYYKKKSM